MEKSFLIKMNLFLLLNNIPGIKSIIQNINSKPTNVILGLESKTLWGEDTISDYIGDFRFNISPLSFFQVNPMQTEVLYSKALEFAELTGNETVFDAYCGTGTITLFLSKKAKKVYGVEIIPQAIDNAWINAKENNVDNVEFFVGESEVVIPDLINKGVKADVVVVDPPRPTPQKASMMCSPPASTSGPITAVPAAMPAKRLAGKSEKALPRAAWLISVP